MAQLKYKDSEGNIHPVRALVTTKVPHMTNPAAVTDVLNGKEYIDKDGQKQVGTMEASIDWIKLANIVSFANTDFQTRDVTMRFENIISTGLNQAFRSSTGVVNLTLYINDGITTLSRFADLSTSIVKIKIIGDLSTVTTYSSMLRPQKIEEADFDFDFSSVTTTTAAQPFGTTEATHLTSARFVPNTLSVSMTFKSSVLDDISTISLANVIKSGTTGTLTISANSKVRAEAITGTVTQVTEGGVTYDFFTQDESGTTTLMNFITQTKGWTVA